MRTIAIPPPIQFFDPLTGKQTETKMDFGEFIFKLMDNPKWAQSYKMVKSADAICAALDRAKTSDPMIMQLEDTDWKNLCEAVDNPKALIISTDGTSHTITGFGIHPRLTPQMVQFMDAIMEARP